MEPESAYESAADVVVPPARWQYSEKQMRTVYAWACARIFGDTEPHACVSMALVVLWSGLGPRRLGKRLRDALTATGHAIARGRR